MTSTSRLLLTVLGLLPMLTIPACMGHFGDEKYACDSSGRYFIPPGGQIQLDELSLCQVPGPPNSFNLEDPPQGLSAGNFNPVDDSFDLSAAPNAQVQGRIYYIISGVKGNDLDIDWYGVGSFYISTIPLSVNPTADPAAIGPGGSVNLDAHATGGVPDLVCSWTANPPDPTLSNATICTPTATPSVTTTYTVTVTDGATRADTVTGKVTVTLNSGLKIVPNVVGMTQSNASSSIIATGLVVGTIAQQISSSVPAGNVISQDPSPGTSVQPGSAVNLAISSGPSPNADLSVTLTAFGTIDGSSFQNVGATGQPVAFTVTVTNNGPADASNVLVKLVLSSSLFFQVQLSGPTGCQPLDAPPGAECLLPSLASGASATYSFKATPTQVGGLLSTATVTAGQPDPNPANNKASNSLLVEF